MSVRTQVSCHSLLVMCVSAFQNDMHAASVSPPPPGCVSGASVPPVVSTTSGALVFDGVLVLDGVLAEVCCVVDVLEEGATVVVVAASLDVSKRDVVSVVVSVGGVVFFDPGGR